MTVVAVTGAARPVGKALLERLDADRGVSRIIGIDDVEPDMPVAKLDFRPADLRDRFLPLALEGADALVHLGLDMLPARDEDTLFARNVGGTRNLLAAASKVGVRRLVHLSDAAAYGAHPDNEVPLDEDVPLRANADYAPAYHALLAEELVAEYADSHPDTAVAVLRPAALVGHRHDGVLAQHLEAPLIVGVRGYEPPVQFVHLDDLAAALHLVAARGLRGAYNVAADGWLSSEELATVLGKRRTWVPEPVAWAVQSRLWRRGLWPAPAGMLHFLMHPVVVSAARLHAVGWTPTRSNREIVRELAAERAGWLRLGPVRVRRRDVDAVALTCAAAGLVALVRTVRSRRSRDR